MTQGMKLSPEQVSLILKRAGELDARGPSITVEELVAIATEAGLDPGATETAIREVISPGGPVPVKPIPIGPSVRSTVVKAAVGAALGVLAGASLAPTIALPAIGGIVIYTLFGLLRGRIREGKLTLFFENFVTWLSFFVGAGAVSGPKSDEIMFLSLLLWAVTSVIGLSLPRGPGNVASPTHGEGKA